jgi:threonine synthase
MRLRKDVVLECRPCGFQEPEKFATKCPDCGQALDVLYDLDTARLRESDNPYERWFDLLPLSSMAGVHWAGEGNTPLVHARRLGAVTGLENLYLKDETRNPTMSAKDRMAGVAVAFLYQRGVREFVISSTGNSSTSMARIVAQLPDMRVHIFCGQDFLDRLQVPEADNVHVYCTNTDFVGASSAATRFAELHSLPFEGGFFNLGRREGLKLAYLETLDQLRGGPEPSAFFQAVSSGMGMLGAYKGLVEYATMGLLQDMPRMICCQQDSCAPMVSAYDAGAGRIRPADIQHHPVGLAKAILRGNPSATYPYMKWIADETGGRIVSVTDDEIHEARGLAAQHEGIDICYSASVALASAIRLRRRGVLASEEHLVVNLTGADRPASKPRNVISVDVNDPRALERKIA